MADSASAVIARPKWNTILKRKDEAERERAGREAGRPEAEPNHSSQRTRSESVPEIRSVVMQPNAAAPSAAARRISDTIAAHPEESMLISALGTDKPNLAKMLDMALWDKHGSAISPLSPLRSPVVADWKAVGHPVVAGHAHSDALPEELPGADVAISEPRPESSPDESTRARRPRVASVVDRSAVFGRKGFSPFDLGDLSAGAQPAALIAAGDEGPAEDSDRPAGGEKKKREIIDLKSESPDKLGGSFGKAQLAQLPRTLHEELGVEDAEEATEIFKRSSMDFLDVQCTSAEESPRKALNSMPSLFGRMPFGPATMVFGSDSPFFPPPITSPEGTETLAAGGEAKTAESNGRRHSSLFGLAEWGPDSGTTMGQDFSVDDYFMGSSTVPRSSNGGSGGSSTLAQNHPRRHSIAAATAALFPETDDQHFGSLSLASPVESSLSPSAAAFQYKGCAVQSSSSSLLDYMSLAASGELNDPYPPLPSAALRDVCFQLSTYKGPLYAVEFKAGRTEIFYVLEMDGKPQLRVHVDDLVIVEADRGEDLGKVTVEISVTRLKQLMMPGSARAQPESDDDILTPELASLVHSKEIVPKRIHRLAQSVDLKLLQAKAQEEAIAMVRCQSRIRQKKLPMEVVDAEYQWDRNKLTFYFCADRRIDFRELVRDLFRIYKTRIWMCAVDKSSPRMILYSSPSGSGNCPNVLHIAGPALSDFPPAALYAANYPAAAARSMQPSPS